MIERPIYSLLCLAVLLTAGYCILDIEGDFCRARRGEQCCPGRADDCSAPILGTLCYCDKFCNRTSNDDCCPDFWSHCLGIFRPKPERRGVGEPQIIHCSGGKTLDEGIRLRLGTFKPTRLTMNMNEIHNQDHPTLPENFDSRQKWPNLIQPVRDQGDCASSWAFSTTALASDRLGIQSNGQERKVLSPQNLLSCQNSRQKGCKGGHLDRAWWYIRKYGVVTEDCYPYDSGKTAARAPCYISRRANPLSVECPNQRGKQSMLYRSAPPYKISHQDKEIMLEISKNGPVQATYKVKRDFFMYKSGVYRHQQSGPGESAYDYHSVRIIGWGVDKTDPRNPIKYWLCANSWGRYWGENGYFRIVRGENECDIEMFVIGIWAKRNIRPRTNSQDPNFENIISE
ncbi:Tubulointerstitial nephritis antigen-like [Nymphon striatum]|nr:Tubulointerstitial nephritis antigen-like [Nymphon striatum]